MPITQESVPTSSISSKPVVILESFHHPLAYTLYEKMSLTAPSFIVIWIQMVEDGMSYKETSRTVQ